MAFLYGMFTGGWGMHYGLERIGATIIPAGSGNTERHIMMMQDFGTTVLVSTPSYALYLAEVGEGMGVDFRELPLRLGLFLTSPSNGVSLKGTLSPSTLRELAYCARHSRSVWPDRLRARAFLTQS